MQLKRIVLIVMATAAASMLACGGGSTASSSTDAASEAFGESASGLTTSLEGSGIAGEDTGRGVLPSSIGQDKSLLQVRLQEEGAQRVPLKNGGKVRLEDNLTAEIFVDPYPTNSQTAWLDVFLHNQAGDPVRDANVAIDYDMFSMAHGPFSGESIGSDTGHYIFRLDYIMFGAWGQLLYVDSPDTGEEHRMELTIVAVP